MGTPSDWVSGERVFGPPSGTFDVDWLVPAVVEQAGVHPAAAREALAAAWAAHRSGRSDDPGYLVTGTPPGGESARQVATAVLAEAVKQFRVD